MKSLLSKTLAQFTICAACLFILATPVFYMLTKHFYAEDLIDIIGSVRHGSGIPPLDLEQDIIVGMTLQIVLIFLVLCIALVVMLRIVTRKMWLPFNDSLDKTEKFNLAQGEIPEFEKTKIIEFNRLNHTLSTLMRRDKETYRIQQEFTENASHELQTPLAVTRGKLDLLMQEKLDEIAMNLVADLYQINTRMEHLNRSLLLLAKIDNSQYADKEQVKLTDMINTLLPAYRILKENLKISFELSDTYKEIIIANKILLECLLNNLVVNAIRHTPNNSGEIVIRLSDNSLTVINPSNGNSLKQDTLFLRFRSSDIKREGNGLGLSIVKAICDYHGWEVAYKFEDNRHAFIVKFNAK
jgi:two-component system OmpR family sensor kinase